MESCRPRRHAVAEVVVVTMMMCFHHMRIGEPSSSPRNRRSSSSCCSNCCVGNNVEGARMPCAVGEELDGSDSSGRRRRCCAPGEPRDVHDLQGEGLLSLDL